MIHSGRGQRIDTVIALIIFCVFAVSVLMVLMLSAGTYGNIIEMSREEHTERMILSYIWTKAKNNDEAGSIYVGEFHGSSALFINEENDQIVYQTTVYHYDGWVYELFCELGLEFFPEDGIRLVRLDNLKFEEIEYGLIKACAGARSLLISPRGSASGGSFQAFPAGSVKLSMKDTRS